MQPNLLSLDDLKNYRPSQTLAPDFQDFWKMNVKEADEQPLNDRWEEINLFTKKIKLTRATFDGFSDRSSIVGVLASDPRGTGRRPLLVNFHDYGMSRGHITDLLGWVSLGYSVFSIDIRGQVGESTDNQRYEQGRVKGWLTAGVKQNSTYYYRYAIMDCCRLLSLLVTRPEVDAERIGVMGVGQGGGLAIAMGALSSKVKTVIAGYPLFGDMVAAIGSVTSGPYLEFSEYLSYRPNDQEKIMKTLSYFDSVNFASLVSAPTLITVGLDDRVSPASSIFATFNWLSCREKELTIYPGVAHGDSSNSIDRRMRWAVSHFDG